MISDREYERRKERLLEIVKERGGSGAIVISPSSVYYFSGFRFIPTERPIAFLMNSSGESAIFCPYLEEEHAKRYAKVDEVFSYYEYPGERSPEEEFAEALKEMKISGKICSDSSGFPRYCGYKGRGFPALGVEVIDIYSEIWDLRKIKSEEEIRVLKESAFWTKRVHSLLESLTFPGKYEEEISLEASEQVTLEMVRSLGIPGELRAIAGFRGQVGKHSYFPHSLEIHAKIRKGDLLVTGATAKILGYGVELERVMYVGEVPKEISDLYSKLMKARERGLEKVRPGIKCSDVEREVRKAMKDLGIIQYARHHSGHGIGMEVHEPPFFDLGEKEILRPGMVMSFEPGIYVKGLGGLRTSDTLLILEDGFEILTEYPLEIRVIS